MMMVVEVNGGDDGGGDDGRDESGGCEWQQMCWGWIRD